MRGTTNIVALKNFGSLFGVSQTGLLENVFLVYLVTTNGLFAPTILGVLIQGPTSGFAFNHFVGQHPEYLK